MAKNKDMNSLYKAGVRQYSPVPIQTVYASESKDITNNHGFKQRAKTATDILNKQMPGGNPANFKGGPVNFFENQTGYTNLKLEETQRAFQSKGKRGVAYDLETIGSSRYSSQGSKNSAFDFLGVTQISLQEFEFGDKQLKESNPIVLSMRISESTKKTLLEDLDKVESNPSYWMQLNEERRRSLIDLGLYKDKEHFGTKNLKGFDMKVMVGQQESKPSMMGHAATSPENLSAMRMGLENITDSRLTNDHKTAVSFMNKMIDSETTLVGHNNLEFDKPAFIEAFQDSLKGSPLYDNFSRPQIDNLTVANAVYGTDPTYKTSDQKLSTLYSNIPGIKAGKQAHFAGDDTDMTVKILEDLMGRESFGTFFGQNTEKSYQPNDGTLFTAMDSLDQYFPSSFNKDQNKYSMVFRKNEDGTGFVPNNGFQERALVLGDEYKLLGLSGKTEIEGLNYYSLMFENANDGTVSVINDTNRDRLISIMQDGKVLPSNDPAVKGAAKHFKEDRARRTYEGIYNNRTRNAKDSSVKQIQEAYKVIDTYDSEFLRLKGAGSRDPHNEALNEVQKIIGEKGRKSAEKQGSYYQKSRGRIENIVGMKDILEEDRDVNRAIVKAAKELYGAPSPNDYARTQEQNNFVMNAFKSFEDQFNFESGVFGEGSPEMIGIQKSIAGEVTYLNISSPKQYEDSIKGMLSVRGSQGPSKVRNNLNAILNDLTGDIHNENAIEMRKLVDRDLASKNGYVSNETIRAISNQTHALARSENSRVNSVGMPNVLARKNGYSDQAGFGNKLQPKEISQQIKALMEDATSDSHARLSTNNKEGLKLSGAMLEQARFTQETVQKLEEGAFANHKIFGLDTGEIAKERARKYAGKLNVEEELAKTLSIFEHQGFDTALFYDPNTKTSSLAFSYASDNLKLGSMSFSQLDQSEKIGIQPLPFMNKTLGIEAGAGSVTHGFTLGVKGQDVSLKSNVQTMFENIQGMAYSGKRLQEENELFGFNKKSSDHIARILSVTNKKNTDGQGFTSFAHSIAKEEAHQVLSLMKSSNQANVADASSVVENYVQKENSYLWKQWGRYKEDNGLYDNVSMMKEEKFWFQQRGVSKQEVHLRAFQDFNDNIGKDVGMKLSLGGMTSGQFASGKAFLSDSRKPTPFGGYNSSTREQIHKAENYRAMEKDNLVEYFEKERGLSRTAAERRASSNQWLGVADLDENIRNSQTKSMGVNMRTMFTNDLEMDGTNKKIQVNLDKKIRDLEQILNSTTDDGARNNIQAQIESLRDNKVNAKKIAKTLSTYDGQAGVRQSVLDNMIVKESRNIVIPGDEQVAFQIAKRVASDRGIDESTIFEGMDLGLKSETHMFKNPISFDELASEEMGLINKKTGKLTVGNLVASAIDGNEDAAAVSGTSKRIGKNAKITGISQRDGKYSLLLSDEYKMSDTSKIVGGAGDGRVTIFGTPDWYMDLASEAAFGNTDQKLDMITESPKLSRSNYGSVMTTMFNTVNENVVEEMERLQAIGSTNLSADTKLPGLRDYFSQKENKMITSQDLSRAQVREGVINGTVFSAMGEMGLNEDHMFVNSKTGRIEFNDVGFIPEMVGKTGQENYTNFFERVKKDFGFDSRFMMAEQRIHNVSEYSGMGTKATMTHIELGLNRLNDTYLYGDKDSPYRTHRETLRERYKPQEHVEYAKKIMGVMEENPNGKYNSSNTMLKDNLILDMSGSMAAAGEDNIFLDKNTGTYIVDGLSIKDAPTEKGRPIKGTYGDPLSIQLKNDELGINTTVGEFIESRDSKAYLRIEGEHQQNVGQKYLPVIGRLQDDLTEYESSNLRKVEKNFAEVASLSRENQIITVGGLQSEQAIARVQSNSQKIAGHISTYEESAHQYLTGSNKGGYTKNAFGYDTQIGMNARTQSYNQTTYQNGLVRNNEIFLGRGKVSDLIEGHEEMMLRMNNVSESEIRRLAKTEGGQRDFILDKLSGTLGEDENFEIFAEFNRYPSQNTTNLSMTSLRVDDDIKEGIYISPVLAKLTSGDYDGDTGYLNLDGYLNTGANKNVMRSVQKDMSYRSSALNKYDMESPDFVKDVFTDMLDVKNVDKFKHYDDPMTFTQDFVTSYQKQVMIGKTHNILVGGRNMMTSVYESALNEGLIDQQQFSNIVERSSGTMSDYMQSFISAKKVTLDAMNFDQEHFASLSPGQQSEYATNLGVDYMTKFTNIEQNLSNPKLGNLDEFINLSTDMGLINDDDIESLQYAYTNFANANQAIVDSGGDTLGRNKVFKQGQSSGDKNADIFRQFASGETSNILFTKETSEIAKDVLSPEKYIEFAEHGAAQQSKIASNISDIWRNGGVKESLSDAAEGQFEMLSAISGRNKGMRHMEQTESIFRAIQSNISGVMDSTAFKAGAGLAAMWVVGSAIKSGPTPEGNEAQQEATPQEIAPGALLTSPTARVTPNSEHVQMNISGTGNVDQAMLAGVVNQQVSAQTGVPMQMNMSVTDNLTKLDKGFYENTLSRILGV